MNLLIVVYLVGERRPRKWVENAGRADRFIDDLKANGFQETDGKTCTIWPAWRISKITVTHTEE